MFEFSLSSLTCCTLELFNVSSNGSPRAVGGGALCFNGLSSSVISWFVVVRNSLFFLDGDPFPAVDDILRSTIPAVLVCVTNFWILASISSARLTR